MVHVFADKDLVDMAEQVLLFTDMGPVIVTDLVLLSTDMDPTVVGLEFLVLATRAVSCLQSMDCLICLAFVQVPVLVEWSCLASRILPILFCMQS